MQEILYIIVLSLASIIVLFILTKLMGYRQMSEMSMFDYINGITFGSIAAEMATASDGGFEKPLLAMIVYALFCILLSFITSKSMKLRHVLTGTSIVLLDNGIIYERNLRKSKIDLNEFLVQCRINGYFDISKLQSAVLEPNGKMSFLPKESDRPIIPSDLQLSPSREGMVANLIIDGNIMEENLRHCGKDLTWLMNQLHGQGASKPEDVLLATCDLNNNVTVFPKTGKSMNLDIFD